MQIIPKGRLASLIVVTVALAAMPLQVASQQMTGFSREGGSRQSQIEEKFKGIPSAEEARKHHRFFTAEPHPAGSERNNLLARHIAQLWEAQG